MWFVENVTELFGRSDFSCEEVISDRKRSQDGGNMNLPTIIIASVIAIIFVAIVVTQIINKKKGKSSCSCGGACGSCGASGFCHPQKNEATLR